MSDAGFGSVPCAALPPKRRPLGNETKAAPVKLHRKGFAQVTSGPSPLTLCSGEPGPSSSEGISENGVSDPCGNKSVLH